MMRIKTSIALWYVLIGVLLCSCASVDQFGSRIRDGNLNSQDALNQETLLNIIRARDLQPLNFFAITQVTGGQSEALTTGLPTVTLGPAATMAEHQTVISNSLASGVSGGYQGNPLVSTQFQSGMLSPIDTRTVALLVASHPREPVFYTVIDQIIFRQLKTQQVFAFFNDPSGDTRSGCLDTIRNLNGKQIRALKGCDYSRFLNLLETFVSGGLSAELIASAPSKSEKPGTPAPAGGTGSGANASTSIGHICFNSTLSSIGVYNPRCGQATSATSTKKFVRFDVAGYGAVEANFIFRSPLGVFAYLGNILRNPAGQENDYNTGDARGIIGTEPFLNITDAQGSPCFTSVLYDGGFYCVPLTSHHTAMLIDILIQLRNLSIQPTDLNSAFTVRLTD